VALEGLVQAKKKIAMSNPVRLLQLLLRFFDLALGIYGGDDSNKRRHP
jgi:hypothetical protein